MSWPGACSCRTAPRGRIGATHLTTVQLKETLPDFRPVAILQRAGEPSPSRAVIHPYRINDAQLANRSRAARA
jgi:hypothetical protein